MAYIDLADTSMIYQRVSYGFRLLGWCLYIFVVSVSVMW